MALTIKTFFDKPTSNATHVVADTAVGVCAVIDSVLGYEASSGRTNTRAADEVIAFIRQSGWTLDWILETHVHADHLSAAPYIRRELGGRTAIGARVAEVQAHFGKVFNAGPAFRTDGSQLDHLFADGEVFTIGSLQCRVMYTPGHTPACAVYLVGDAVFTGDTLFMPDSGTARCDFPGGSARTLYRSIRSILALPPETRVFLCHDYGADGKREHRWETTVAEQRASNIHVKDGVSEDEYVAMREARDRTLSMPALILPSIQVNMRAGDFPPAEDNGTCYLKIPVDVL